MAQIKQINLEQWQFASKLHYLPHQGSTITQPIQLKGWLHLLLSEDAPTDVNMSSGNLPTCLPACQPAACRAHFSHYSLEGGPGNELKVKGKMRVRTREGGRARGREDEEKGRREEENEGRRSPIAAAAAAAAGKDGKRTQWLRSSYDTHSRIITKGTKVESVSCRSTLRIEFVG